MEERIKNDGFAEFLARSNNDDTTKTLLYFLYLRNFFSTDDIRRKKEISEILDDEMNDREGPYKRLARLVKRMVTRPLQPKSLQLAVGSGIHWWWVYCRSIIFSFLGRASHSNGASCPKGLQLLFAGPCISSMLLGDDGFNGFWRNDESLQIRSPKLQFRATI
jgi:hypothetical protein